MRSIHIPRKLFWSVLSVTIAIIAVLTSLTIYFAVRPHNQNHVYYGRTTSSETTESIELTTSRPSGRPVERIPSNLKPELYEWTIVLDLNDELFTGDLLYTFTCLQTTTEVILHTVDLLIEHSTIAITNASSLSRPLYHSCFYDDHNQFLKLRFSSAFIPGATYTLRITYSARLQRDMRGLYLSDYTDVHGAQRTLLIAHMKSAYARRALPCIDEPTRKARFHLHIEHNRALAVWSNTELVHTEALADDRIISHFAPTSNISSYHLALIVAPADDFRCQSKRPTGSKPILSRMCRRTQLLPRLAYIDEVASRLLDLFLRYFDIDYSGSKLEHFAIPDFRAGVMESNGLTIYGEFDTETSSTAQHQQAVASIAGATAYQWLGSLDPWLEKGIAKYLGTRASAVIEPAWSSEELLAVAHMEIDSFHREFSKGERLIRMMDIVLGAEVFQRGIRTYLRAFNSSLGTQRDLWHHLSRAANYTLDVERVMDTWTQQAGFPIVTVNRVYTDSYEPHVAERALVLTQRPSPLLLTDDHRTAWYIPFKYFDRASLQATERIKPIVWLNATWTRLPITTSDADWILADPAYHGVYRTEYDARNFRLLLAQLESEHTGIPAMSRAVLIDDTFALSCNNVSDAYALLAYLKNERDFVPWIAALSAMDRQEQLLTGSDLLLEVQQYFLELQLPLYNTIGWASIDQMSEWRQARLQPMVLSSVCAYGHRECLDAARRIYRRWSINPVRYPIPISLQSTVFCVIIRESAQTEFWFLWDRLDQQSSSAERTNLLDGLACTRDPSLLVRLLNRHLNETSTFRPIARIARSAHGNIITWNWIREHWSQLFAKWGRAGSDLGDLMAAVTSRFVTVRQRDEFHAFASSTTQDFQPSLDKINEAIAWREANIPLIADFLRSRTVSTAADDHLSVAVPLHYDLHIRPHLNVTEGAVTSVFDGRVSIRVNITRATDRLVLYKRSISIIDPIEITGGVAVVRTVFNAERDLYTLVLDRTIPADTQTTVTLSYVGQLSEDAAGFYLRSYVRSSDKTQHYYVASQMAGKTRQAFPAFDESMFKCTFTVSVDHDARYQAWSNMHIAEQSNLSNGFVRTKFATSPLMTASLLALVVADFQCLIRNGTGRHGNITTRVCARPEKVDHLHYALEVASVTMRDLEIQYQVNFPLTKCDHIAVRDFDAVAMENFGCAIYSESQLFYHNRTSTSLNKQNVAQVVAHEIAHQWFGDLVSLAWFGDAWLNEGFAEWMEFSAASQVQPEWGLLDQHLAHRWLFIMQNDGNSFSHALSMDPTHGDLLGGAFDIVTYAKGSSLVRMLRNVVTETTFNRGLMRYLTRHLYSTARPNDLWRAMSEQMVDDGLTLTTNASFGEIMDTWIRQMGYPYVQVIRDYETNTISISQQQFLFDSKARPPSSPYHYRWHVPFTFRSSSTETSNVTWFNQAQINMTIDEQIPSSDWLLANPNLFGFFRANYDERNWRLIIEQLRTGHEQFTIAERTGLADDLFNLARASIIPISLVFEMLSYARSERTYAVWDRLLAGISYIAEMIETSDASGNLYERLRRFIIDCVLPDDSSNRSAEDWSDALYRDAIMSAACRYGSDDCIDRAKRLFQQWLHDPSNNPIDPNERELIYCTNVRLSGRVPFHFLLTEYGNSDDPHEILRIHSALACTRDTGLIRFLLDIHTNPQTSIIQRHGLLSGLRSVCRNTAARTECWSLMRSQWTRLLRIHGRSLFFAELVKDVLAQLNTAQQLEEFEHFFADTIDKGTAKVEFQASMERIHANIRWIETVKPGVEQWFANRARE